MNEKKITSVYVEKRLLELAKVRGINVSEVLNNVLKSLVEDETVIQLENLEKRIIELEAELQKLRAQREAIRKAREEKLAKENREEAIRQTLERLKAALRNKNRRAGTREEAEINREILKLKAELTRLTGMTEGSVDWVEVMRALNLNGVEAAVKLAMRRGRHE